MKNKVHLSTESRIHREVYVRFGGRLSKTCRSNTTRRRVPSLHYYFDVEKKDSIKTLLLTLWKTEDDKITKTESGELGSAVNAYIERIRADRNIVPCFDSFYEYLRDDYRRELEEREIRVSREDFNIDNMLITLRQYYKGGRYDFLLNSRANIDLLSKRFVVFEVDSIKENKELFPVVT
ncbi:TraG family conjugative transposon ATPase, partial [Bacteroides ovatus]